MKISLRGLSIFMIVLALLVFVIGRNISGSWVYSILLLAFGISFFVKGNKNGNKK